MYACVHAAQQQVAGCRTDTKTNWCFAVQEMDRGGDLTFVSSSFMDWLLMVENDYVRKFLNPADVGADSVQRLHDALLCNAALKEGLFNIIQTSHASKLRNYPPRVHVVHQFDLDVLWIVFVDLVSVLLTMRVREFKRQVVGLLEICKQEDALRRRLKNTTAAVFNSILKFHMTVEQFNNVGAQGFHDLLLAAITLSHDAQKMLDTSINAKQVAALYMVYRLTGKHTTKKDRIAVLLPVIKSCSDVADLNADAMKSLVQQFKD